MTQMEAVLQQATNRQRSHGSFFHVPPNECYQVILAIRKSAVAIPEYASKAREGLV